MQYVFPTGRVKRYRFPTHVNDLVVDRADAKTSEVFVVRLKPGEAPPLHRHNDTEQIFYMMAGEGVLRIGRRSKKFRVKTGDVIRIPPDTFHSIQCAGKRPLSYLSVDCFTGGRPKAEPTWDAHVKQLCREQGWDYGQISKAAMTSTP